MNFLLVKTKSDIEKFFKKEVLPFCSERKINPSFENFLSFKKTSEQVFPDSINYYFSGTMPKMLVASNSVFSKNLSSFPEDFKRDIEKTYKLNYTKKILITFPEIKKYLTEIK